MPVNTTGDLKSCDSHPGDGVQPLPPGVLPGARVTARGARWRLDAYTPHDDCGELHLSEGGAGETRVLLWPFDRPTPTDRVRPMRVVSWRAWARIVAALVTTRMPCGGIRASSPAARLLPYQLEAPLAIARGEHRLLIADEVGLGKTIQAGWIIADLVARTPDARALVCTPAGLREQWRRELARFFDIQAIDADSRWLRRAVADLPADVSPWRLPGVYVASIDFIKRADEASAAAREPWDLLVVDEAHAAAAPTDRHAAIAGLARSARRIVLLTATPFSGDIKSFNSLAALGSDPARPLPMLRRSRADAGDGRSRRHRLMPVTLSPADQRLQRLLERYTRVVWGEDHTDHTSGARLAMTILRKRALSSASAVARSLRRRAALLACVDEGPRQLPLFADEDHDPADEEPSAALAVPGLDDRDREVRWLHRLADAADAAGQNEAKRRFLKRLLSRLGGESAIVFTEYRDTLIELARDHPHAHQLHGGLPRRDRDLVQRRFNDAGGLLLATDAAAEGLNLQERCRIAINYELPWNPGRLEQRIGRVDRIGQRRPVHAITLVARDTAEDLVLANIIRRLTRVAATLGATDRLAAFLDEMRVAHVIVGGAPADTLERISVAEAVATSSEPGDAQVIAVRDAREEHAVSANEEASRLEVARRLSAAARHHVADFIPVARATRSIGIAPGLLFVFRWRLVTSAGHACATEIVPVHVPALVRSPRTQADARAAVTDAARRAAETLARAEAKEAASRAMVTHERARAAEIAREQELAGHAVSGGLIQPGLFDARALQQAGAALAQEASRAEEHGWRLRRLDATRVPETEIELAGVLIVPAWG